MKFIKLAIISLLIFILCSCSIERNISSENQRTHSTQGSTKSENKAEPVYKNIENIDFPVVSEGVYDMSCILGANESRGIINYPEKNVAIFVDLLNETAEITPYDLKEKVLYSEKAQSIEWKRGKGYRTEAFESAEGILIHIFEGSQTQETAVYYDAKLNKIEIIELKFDLMSTPLGYSEDYGFLYDDSTSENGRSVFSYNIDKGETSEVVKLDLASLSNIVIVNDQIIFSGQAYKNPNEQSVGVYGMASLNGDIDKIEYMPNNGVTFENGFIFREIVSIDKSSVDTLGKFFVLNADGGDTRVLETEDKNETLGNFYISKQGSFLATETFEQENEQTVVRIYDVKGNRLLRKVSMPLHGYIHSVSEEGSVLFSFIDESGTKTHKIIF